MRQSSPSSCSMPFDLAPGFSPSTTQPPMKPLATSLASWKTSGVTSVWTSSPTYASTVFLPSKSTVSSRPCAQVWPSWRSPTSSVTPACHSGRLRPTGKGGAVATKAARPASGPPTPRCSLARFHHAEHGGRDGQLSTHICPPWPFLFTSKPGPLLQLSTAKRAGRPHLNQPPRPGLVQPKWFAVSCKFQRLEYPKRLRSA